MATSGTVTYNASVSDIITEAMEVVGVLDLGESPSTAEVTSGIRSLNLLLKSLQTDPLVKLRFTEEKTVALVASTATYTLESDVEKVLYAWMVLDGTTVPMEWMTEQEYDLARVNRTAENQPQSYIVDYAPDTPTVTIYPVPAEAYTLYYMAERTVEDITVDTEDFDLPVKALDMVCKGLQSVLASKYQIPLQERGYFDSKFAQAQLMYKAGDTEATGLQVKTPSNMMV